MEQQQITFSRPQWGDLADRVVTWTNRRQVFLDGKQVGVLFGYAENPANPMRPTKFIYHDWAAKGDEPVTFTRLDEARNWIARLRK